ncbi:MAG: hypothetical protein V9F03_05525 [Microthrixaceae bacterium]
MTGVWRRIPAEAVCLGEFTGDPGERRSHLNMIEVGEDPIQGGDGVAELVRVRCDPVVWPRPGRTRASG